MSAPAFCSQRAQAHNDTPAGTATEASHWLLVEDPSPWGRDALSEADWFASVQGRLAQWKRALPGLRVQLIRRRLTEWETPGQIRCFVVRAGRPPILHTRVLPTYDALARLDVPHLVQTAPTRRMEALPLLLTCTNGRRDACCAKWGRPVAEAARAAHPGGAWQTSHLGGHRFAPTMLVLPSGAQYGWVEPEAVPALVAAHRSGDLYDLKRYRGCVGDRRPSQAACIALRKRRDLRALQAIRSVHVKRCSAAGADRPAWRVRIETAHSVVAATVHQETGPAFRHSCHSDTPKPSRRFVVSWAANDNDCS